MLFQIVGDSVTASRGNGNIYRIKRVPKLEQVIEDIQPVQGVDLSRIILRKSLRVSVDMGEPVLRPLRLLRGEGLTRINLVAEIHIFLR